MPAPKGRKRFMASDEGPSQQLGQEPNRFEDQGQFCSVALVLFLTQDFTSFMNSQDRDRREEKPFVTNRSPFAICDKC